MTEIPPRLYISTPLGNLLDDKEKVIAGNRGGEYWCFLLIEIARRYNAYDELVELAEAVLATNGHGKRTYHISQLQDKAQAALRRVNGS